MSIEAFLTTLIAGFVGTVCMTIIMYLYAAVSGYDTKVVHLFGTMASGSADHLRHDGRTLIIGSIGHLLAGYGFAFSYFFMWNWGIFSIEMSDTFILGALSGVAAVIIWNTYLTLHHRPPKINRIHYSIALFLAHIVFGIVTVYIFKLLVPEPVFWYELLEKGDAA